jgi:hypothetical protein
MLGHASVAITLDVCSGLFEIEPTTYALRMRFIRATGIYAGANGTLTIRHGRHGDFFTVALR